MDGTTVVVTGAVGGLGRAVTDAFADEGATVVACGRADSDVESTYADVDGVVPFHADARDEFDLERLMEFAAREAGPIDVVVPCAVVAHGDPGESPLQTTSYAAFDDAMRTNARGVFAAVKEAVPHMAGDARVLVPSGRVAREPTPGMGEYAVSKAAAEAVARGFSADLDQCVGVLDPGRVATDLTDGEGRDPEDVAPMFLWAATEANPGRVDGAVVDVKTWVNETRREDRDAGT